MKYPSKLFLTVLVITAFLTCEKAAAQSATADTVSININLNNEIGHQNGAAQTGCFIVATFMVINPEKVVVID